MNDVYLYLYLYKLSYCTSIDRKKQNTHYNEGGIKIIFLDCINI